MESTEERILHYQRGIDRSVAVLDKARLLHCIKALSKLPVTMHHLKSTGIGRTVNSLRKIEDGVGDASKRLVTKWKEMVSNAPDSGESDEACVPDDPDNYESVNYEQEHASPKEDDDDAAAAAATAEEEGDGCNGVNRPEALDRPALSPPMVIDVNISPDEEIVPNMSDEEEEQQQHQQQPEETNYSQSSKHSSSSKEKDSKKDSKAPSSSSSRNSESKDKRESSKISKNSKDNGNHEEHKKKDKDKSKSKSESSSSSSSSKRHNSEVKKRKVEESSDENDDVNEDNRKKQRVSVCENESENEDDFVIAAADDAAASSSDERDSSDKHKDASSLKHSDTGKSKSKDKRKKDDSSSSSSSSKTKSKDERKSKDDRHKSKSSHSSSNGKDREKHGKAKDEEKARTKEKKDHKKSKEKKKAKRSGSIDNLSGTSFGDALGMCSMPPPTKKKKEGSSSSKSSQPSPSKSSSSKAKTEPRLEHTPPPAADDSPDDSLSLLSPNVKLEPLAGDINEEVDLASTLPEPSPYYKPLPQVNHVQRRVDEEEMLSQVINAKVQRTKVYSGNKAGWTSVPSLQEICIRVLIENIDALEYTGGVPYDILQPILERASADQLQRLEYFNPYLVEETDLLWKFHCNKIFKTKLREEMESWRDMYERCMSEREAKFKAITATIKQGIDKSTPVRSTKLAYVDHFVKPPRNVLRQQAKYGTAKVATSASDLKKKLITGSAGPSGSGSSSAERISVPPPPPSRVRPPSSHPIKKTKAPLMAKALQAIKGRYKR